ncbi:hypothetical protein IFM89_023030 [Coptis chinensis]|uniref:non-specific serine/threonine protein kinase n=1 Tax=Coptis chinensis TaxID=261450 RepID=A0A835IEF0_9MAGN|nr:hypothetical protein IFM89_023030 [Coptis chinensis]
MSTTPPPGASPAPTTSPPSPPAPSPNATSTPPTAAPPPTNTPPPTPPTTSPPPPTTPAGSPPPSQSPPPPPPRNTSSRPSPPTPVSGRSPPSPLSGLSPPSPSSNGISIGTVVGIAIGGVVVLVVLSLLFVCCKKKKRRRDNGALDYYGGAPPPGPKDGPYGMQHQQWQQNAPPPPQDHVISMLPKPTPPPGLASRPPQSPVCPMPTPPPPPPFMSSSGGSGSNYSGSSNPQPPPSPGLSLGFSKSTFTYEELSMATDGFSDANLLGQGGFGYVHRGMLPNGKEVAVKQLKVGSGQGEREFQAEVEIISRVHHKHLVSLVGYCMTGDQRMLVYEFVPNDTLEFHLHGKGRPVMDWASRMKIALGSAKGLAYLHEDLLGSIYLQPKTEKTNAVEARPLLTRAMEDGNYDTLIDRRLQKDYNPNEMACMVACAAACVRHSARRRPRMSQIVRALEGDVSLSDLNEGIRPGHSTVYSSHGSSDYDTSQYNEDMRKFRKMALASQEYASSENSRPTSEYGLYPSGSSSEGQQTKEMEMGKRKKDSQGFIEGS